MGPQTPWSVVVRCHPTSPDTFQDALVMRRSAVRIRSQAPSQRPFLKLFEEGCPIPRAFVETDATELTVIIQLYCLNGCIVRHGTSVQVVTGGAYLSAPTFA